MTQELAVISGKGGTGKTSMAAALAALAQPVVLADCDVDAPDLHILTTPQVRQQFPFSGCKKASVDAGRCCGCGFCVSSCRFNAITQGVDGVVVIDPIACEGCGACVTVCSARAIELTPQVNGEWMLSETRFGPMVHAALHPGEENSGKLVSMVRREASSVAEKAGVGLVIVDGSPGIGCPVIASLANTRLALVVAEPTPSGVHDAKRVMELARQLRVRTALCVNRWDLNPALTAQLEDEAVKLGATPVGRVREDLAVVHSQMQGTSVTELPDSPAATDVRGVWSRLKAMGLCDDHHESPSRLHKEQSVKIAIPTDQGRLAQHFGRCPHVTLFSVSGAEITDQQKLDMPPHEPGRFPTWLREQGADVVIAGGMGRRALELFAQAGIQVIVGAPPAPPAELMSDLLLGKLADGANVCSHPSDHHC